MNQLLALVVAAAIAAMVNPEQFHATLDWMGYITIEMAKGLINFLWAQLAS